MNRLSPATPFACGCIEKKPLAKGVEVRQNSNYFNILKCFGFPRCAYYDAGRLTWPPPSIGRIRQKVLTCPPQNVAHYFEVSADGSRPLQDRVLCASHLSI